MRGGGLWRAVLDCLRTFDGAIILTARPGLADELSARVRPFAESVDIVEAGDGL